LVTRSAGTIPARGPDRPEPHQSFEDSPWMRMFRNARKWVG